MSVHLDNEILLLKKKILHLSSVVEQSVIKAVQSVTENNVELAAQVIDEDDIIDQMEIELEEECLKIIALHQPVAQDLRYVVACMKINNDLERIGDLSVNIAERTQKITEEKNKELPFDFTEMMQKTQMMLNQCLDAFIENDISLASQVCQMDDEIDQMNRDIYNQIKKMIKKKSKKTSYYLHLLGVARQLERIGDYATNIAEDVIYMIEGKIVRHTNEQANPSPEMDIHELDADQ